MRLLQRPEHPLVLPPAPPAGTALNRTPTTALSLLSMGGTNVSGGSHSTRPLRSGGGTYDTQEAYPEQSTPPPKQIQTNPQYFGTESCEGIVVEEGRGVGGLDGRGGRK
eukprot:1016221-Rhodomonas_salina.1